jgi:hypothetical protein
MNRSCDSFLPEDPMFTHHLLSIPKPRQEEMFCLVTTYPEVTYGEHLFCIHEVGFAQDAISFQQFRERFSPSLCTPTTRSSIRMLEYVTLAIICLAKGTPPLCSTGLVHRQSPFTIPYSLLSLQEFYPACNGQLAPSFTYLYPNT